MLSTEDRERAISWIQGDPRLPDSFNLIVLGPRQNVPTEFDTFICLYPDKPRVRTFKLPEPGVVRDPRTPILACELPDDAEPRYKRYMRSAFPTVRPEAAWELGVGQARKFRLPLGLYAVGNTALLGRPRAMLVMNALVPPARFLEAFKRAVR